MSALYTEYWVRAQEKEAVQEQCNMINESQYDLIIVEIDIKQRVKPNKVIQTLR